MKCLKSSKTGEIIRVSDEKAEAATSEWKYIPKSEWKAANPRRISVETIKEMQAQAEKKEQTVSEKVIRRKKLKEKQREL